MSDFFHPMTTQASRKRHRCDYCGQHIERGMRYCRQSGVYDGAFFTNRMHPECWSEMISDCDGEFSPGDNARPGATPDQKTPERVQLQRTKGWRMPANTVKVDRTTSWGNPFTPTMVCVTPSKTHKRGEPIGVAGAVKAFRTSWETKLRRTPDEAEAQLAMIRGKSLACWCKRGAPCHADVLLELANAVDRKTQS